MKLPILGIALIFFHIHWVLAQPNQIAIPRVALMPNQPAPYNLRDWRQVAIRYDSFVYDLQKTGQYLPLSGIVSAGINYPQNPSFRLHTYVGTFSPFGNEAINVLPSLVGATLVGMDKSDQFGKNWLLMAQDFYNKANGENLYLNNAGASSGSDWWYDMMPNVFFYQLHDLYAGQPNAEAEAQFVTIADKMLEAVRAMGGNDAPWAVPYMNYRAWKFKTMQPLVAGVPEPEAAGAFAWLLYNAYIKTGNANYCKGAEWAMEFLSAWPTNPSYELQLPYGTYTAAKMNAELGTQYDIEKMVNWSFDRGFLRGWGTVVGTWGGLDASGLVGEANDAGNDYAFQLNGTQQAAALVPMVRYDKRFARDIGKWILNLSNAMRLFYPGFLPANQQDAAAWSASNDPQQVIGYEALRQKYQNLAPYSTGDALQGGWAATNLALYGSGSIGYLGAILEETNVEKILKLDVLKTDFYGSAAYPTYLLYNPYATAQTVQFDAGTASADLFESLSETFVQQNVSGMVNLVVPANQAVMVTICPTGGVVSFDKNKRMVNGIVIDFDQHALGYTHAPRIKAVAAAQNPMAVGESTTIFATADDADTAPGQLIYHWNAPSGTFSGSGDNVIFTAPASPANIEIRVIVEDPMGNQDTAFLQMPVVAVIPYAPQIAAIEKSAAYIAPNAILTLECLATDANNDLLTYAWSANGGTFSGSGNIVDWTAPMAEGIVTINVVVSDGTGLSVAATTTILVKNFDGAPGNIVAHYPFSGNPNDISGNQLNGQANGAILTTDQHGTLQSAYYFNGGAQHIAVPNHPLLNFQDGITVSCWFKANDLPAKETFLLSHGSWQNRWKISITPEKRLRWTLNSMNSIADLDLDLPLQTDQFYHLAATYDGTLLALYLNGELRTYKVLTGKIRTTTFPFLMGQMLPAIGDYNFKGVIDAVKIYDYALAPTAIKMLYEQSVVTVKNLASTPKLSLLLSPNPVSDILNINIPSDGVGLNLADCTVLVRNMNGQLMDLSPTTLRSNSSFKGGSLDLDVKHLTTGVYTVLLVGKDRQEMIGQFIKI